MENASKALLIAGSMLLAILIISMIIISYTSMTDYFNKDNEMKRTEEIAKFNSEYSTYIRNDVKGIELLSLINKAADYNNREAEQNEKMNITIEINNNYLEEFYYDKRYAENNHIDLIKNKNMDLVKLSNKVQAYNNDKKIQLLTKKISTLFDGTVEEINEIINEIYNSSIPIDKAKKDVSEYYQIRQFKKGIFRCKENDVKYSDSGRINNLSFVFSGKLN